MTKRKDGRPPKPKWAIKWCEVDGWSNANCSCPDDPPKFRTEYIRKAPKKKKSVQ